MISEVFLFLAGIFAVLGAIGLFRFPDFYNRSHAATMISMGGVTLAMLVLMLGERFLSVYFFKIAIVIILLLLTGPTATHAIANKAYMMGVKPSPIVRNEMESRPGGGRK